MVPWDEIVRQAELSVAESKSDAACVAEKREHKKLDPDIKAMRAINRALADLPDDDARRRVMEWVVARGLGKSWISLPRFRWITGGGWRCRDCGADEPAEQSAAAVRGSRG